MSIKWHISPGVSWATIFYSRIFSRMSRKEHCIWSGIRPHEEHCTVVSLMVLVIYGEKPVSIWHKIFLAKLLDQCIKASLSSPNAEYRYGREEMLALFGTFKNVPEELYDYPTILSEEPLKPVSFLPFSGEGFCTVRYIFGTPEDCLEFRSNLI